MKKLLVMMLIISAMFAFTACSNSDDGPEVLKVSFPEDQITLHYYDSYTLKPIIESGNFELSEGVWLSSNEEVATVDDNGNVWAQLIIDENSHYGKGESIISLSYNGELLATCKVIVTPWASTFVTLKQHELDLLIGKTFYLKAYVDLWTNLVWESSDDNVVTVSQDGIVTAVAKGNATITVSIAETEVSDKCNVTVYGKDVTGITCQESVKVLLGGSIQIEAVIEPVDATNKNIVWTSSNPAIATVDNEGNVYGVSFGEAIVTATTEDGGFEASCVVNVVDQPEMVTSMAISGYTVSGTDSRCHLTLLFETNTSNLVFINSVTMTDQNGVIMDVDYPNEYYTIFQKTYITHYFDASGGISGDRLNEEVAKIKGWKFYVQFTWNNNEYTIECTND